MKNHVRIFGICLLAFSILLSACNSPRITPAPTENQASLVLTAAAQTAQARLTELALITPTAAPTEAPTATPEATLAVPTLALTSSPSGTVAATTTLLPLTTVTPKPNAGASTPDQGEFISDVSIPDMSPIAPDTGFTKTWKLKNIGSTTWTTAYSLVHVSSNDGIKSPASVPLPKEVPPGESVEISVDMTSSTNTGTYTSYWKLSNASGTMFNTRPSTNGTIYVQIKVTASGESEATSTPGGTPEATSTPGGASGAHISDVTLGIDSADYSGQCPHTFTLSASFTLGKAETVTYGLEAGSDTAGYQFNLPGTQTSAFPEGTQTLTFSLELTSTGSGWVRFRVTAPEDVASHKVSFNLTCQP